MTRSVRRQREREARRGAGRGAEQGARRKPEGELPAWVGPVLLSAALVALVVVTFGPALSAGFINLDDDRYVWANPHVLEGLTWASVKWAWTSHYLGYQIPLTWMSLMLDSSLAGTEPAGYHQTNVLLHAGGAVLLMLALRRASGSTWRAALAAALWAVHPLRVESVAWVTERKDVLAGFFGFGALYAYTWYAPYARGGSGPGASGAGGERATAGRICYALTIFLYCLSLLSKPQLIMTLPVVLWLLDYWPLRRMRRTRGGPEAAAGAGGAEPDVPRRSGWSLALEKWPLVLATLVAAAATAYSEHQEGKFLGDVTIGTGARLANAVVAPVRYLEKLVDFRHLAPVYPLSPTWSPAAVTGSGAFLLVVTAWVVWQRRRRPWLAVGWFWFLVALGPGLTPPPGLLAVSMADRFSYFPAVGLSLMVVWSIPEVWARTSAARGWLAAGAGLVALVFFSRVQSEYWRDSITLWRHTLAVTTGNWLGEHDLATALAEKGMNLEALEHLKQCLRINPNYARGWLNEAALLNRMGPAFAGKALECADRAIALKPDEFQVRYNRILALDALGRYDEVVRESEVALRLKPDSAEAHNFLGIALVNLGRRDEALPHFRTAMRLDPDYAAARNNLLWAMHQPATRATTVSAGVPATGPTTAPTSAASRPTPAESGGATGGQ